MNRRLFIILSALSLLLCVAVLGVWFSSYCYVVRAARYSRPRDGAPMHTHTIAAYRGLILVHVERWGRGGRRGVSYQLIHHAHDPDGGGLVLPDHTFVGFGHSFWPIPPNMVDSYFRVLSVPLWPVAGILALPSVIGSAVWCKRRSRAASGRCPSCGYDLRATPDRCPECGMVPDERLSSARA